MQYEKFEDIPEMVRTSTEFNYMIALVANVKYGIEPVVIGDKMKYVRLTDEDRLYRVKIANRIIKDINKKYNCDINKVSLDKREK